MRFDAIVVGGGSAGMQAAAGLQEQGRKVAVFFFGIPLEEPGREQFKAAGGVLVPGDRILRGTIEDGRVTGLVSERLGALSADEYVLATGRFFSGGLVADMDRIYEPVFGLDVDSGSDPSEWVNPDFGAEQPFMSFGVRADSEGHPFKDGVRIDNLTVCGDIISGRRAK